MDGVYSCRESRTAIHISRAPGCGPQSNITVGKWDESARLKPRSATVMDPSPAGENKKKPKLSLEMPSLQFVATLIHGDGDKIALPPSVLELLTAHPKCSGIAHSASKVPGQQRHHRGTGFLVSHRDETLCLHEGTLELLLGFRPRTVASLGSTLLFVQVKTGLNEEILQQRTPSRSNLLSSIPRSRGS
jgi:hypothetical protein